MQNLQEDEPRLQRLLLKENLHHLQEDWTSDRCYFKDKDKGGASKKDKGKAHITEESDDEAHFIYESGDEIL